MFICIVERKGEIHIVDYHLPKLKIYYTVCEKSIKLYGSNTFAADNTFSGMCSRCASIYNEMYLDDLNFEPATVRTSLNSQLTRKYILTESQIDIPQNRYNYCFNRGWRKLIKINRFITNRK